MRVAGSEIRVTSAEVKDVTLSSSKGGKPINKELQKLQRKMANLEKEIEQKNNDKVRLEADMSNPASYANNEGFLKLEKNYNDTISQLAVLNKEYEQLFETVMQMEGS
ncbi:MAG: ABC transporter C-terminal domain-containing protein [Sediminibacterium sp.]